MLLPYHVGRLGLRFRENNIHNHKSMFNYQQKRAFRVVGKFAKSIRTGICRIKEYFIFIFSQMGQINLPATVQDKKLVIILLAIFSCCQQLPDIVNTRQKPDYCDKYPCFQGGIIRGSITEKQLALVFTGDTFGDGGEHIRSVLQRQGIKASFFLTGNFYRDPAFAAIIRGLRQDGHYLGAHSDRHLLYCPWENRDSLLVSREVFLKDLADNYTEMARFGIEKQEAAFFLPPYEWYNDSISTWTADWGLQLINYTSGTRSHADYTTPEMPAYLDSETIYQSIVDYEAKDANGFNGFLLLSHIGTDPARVDKFYDRLEELIIWLKNREYVMVGVNELL